MRIWSEVSDRFRFENLAHLLQANPQLQILEIKSDFGLTLNTVLNAIEQNPNISKLNVMHAFGSTIGVNMGELNRVAIHWLILWNYRIKADDAINFIGQLNAIIFTESIKQRMAIQCFWWFEYQIKSLKIGLKFLWRKSINCTNIARKKHWLSIVINKNLNNIYDVNKKDSLNWLLKAMNKKTQQRFWTMYRDNYCLFFFILLMHTFHLGEFKYFLSSFLDHLYTVYLEITDIFGGITEIKSKPFLEAKITLFSFVFNSWNSIDCHMSTH